MLEAIYCDSTILQFGICENSLAVMILSCVMEWQCKKFAESRKKTKGVSVP
jgi:hypothetical protein